MTHHCCRALLLLAATAVPFAVLAGRADAQSRSITIVESEEPDVVEPCIATRSNVGRVVLKNIAEPLTEINPVDGSVTPRLATGWRQVDGDTWRFELREGITFHDGEVFDAQAVAYSLERTLDPALACEMAFKFFGGIEVTTEVVDARTIDITASPPQPILPTMMGVMAIVSPQTPRDEFAREPAGTGPYTLDQWNVGRDIILKSFPDYWGEQPEVETATYVFREESAVRAAMVEAGEADIAPNIAVQDATDPKLDFSYPNSETTHLRIDSLVPPLNDVRVRQALNLAIDRPGMQGSIFSADVIPAAQLVTSSINGHNPDLKVWPYDPERAQALLDEARAAGVAVDAPIKMYGRIGIYPNATETMEAMFAMYQQIGLNVDLEMLEVGVWNDLFTKPYAADRGPSVIQGMHDNNNGDAVFTVFNKYHSSGIQGGVADPRLDEVITKAQGATGDERRRLWQEAFRMVNDEVVADVLLFHMVGYTRVGPRVDFKPSIATNSELQIAQIGLTE